MAETVLKKAFSITSVKEKSGRLLSLDLTRGLIMCLLALESTEFYHHVREAMGEGQTLGVQVIGQFFHVQWRGLHFWDLIQPMFMFMAGVAMTYSLTKQIEQGVPAQERFLKVLKRSAWLVFWGIFKRISSPEWFALDALDVTDILTQLAFASLIAYALFNLRLRDQLLSAIAILLLTEILYRTWSVPGFNQGFTNGHNFGNWVDLLLFGQHSSGYVFINWLPTAVHTLAGVMVGKLFLQKAKPLPVLLGMGAILVFAGYALDLLQITPMIKTLATNPFMLASLGYCLLILAFFYWWIDVRMHRKGLLFFQVLGMNSIFIYLFFDIVGKGWLNEYTFMVLSPIFQTMHIQLPFILILSSLCTFAIEWYICYFLYKKNIFFKL